MDPIENEILNVFSRPMGQYSSINFEGLPLECVNVDKDYQSGHMGPSKKHNINNFHDVKDMYG